MTVNRCDIILPTCGQMELIKNCVESLVRHTKYPVRLIVIDNGKSESSSDYLKAVAKSGRLDMMLIKPDENLGWIRSINLGLELSKDSEYVSFQNDDTVFTEGWLDELVTIFEKDPGVGIINPEWEKPEGSDIDKYAAELKKYSGQTVDMDWCRGHCFVVRRGVIDKIGGFDPVYTPVYYDDRDYSIKAIEAGYRCVKAIGSFVDHVRNVSMKSAMDQKGIADLMERNGKIFYKRWGYHLRIVFAFKDPSGSKDILRKMCMDQNKVIVLARKKDNVPYRHTNLKVIKFPVAFFYLASVFYLLSNRSTKPQKKTDFIFTDDRALYSFLKPFSKFIKADIIFRGAPDELAGDAANMVREKKEKDKRAMA